MGVHLRGSPLILWAAAHLLLLHWAGSTSHSLRYFYTAVSEPGQGLPQFIIVGYVNDQQFIQYDSDTKETLPRVPWMRKVEKDDPQYWDRNTQISQGTELTFRVSLQNLRNRYNQSGGIHTVQWMYGCELGPDGRKGGHYQDSYDGRDFITFDKETLTWTAADAGAQVTKRKWDPDLAQSQNLKAYLEYECIEWLQRYLDYGKESLLRTEAPVVKVTRKADYDGLETLVCQVHGFYPKEIEANWVKDGEVWLEGTSRGLVAPNSDGTYYVLLSVKIDPEERDRFRCCVEHDSLEEPLDVAWEKPGAHAGTHIPTNPSETPSHRQASEDHGRSQRHTPEGERGPGLLSRAHSPALRTSTPEIPPSQPGAHCGSHSGCLGCHLAGIWNLHLHPQETEREFSLQSSLNKRPGVRQLRQGFKPVWCVR